MAARRHLEFSGDFVFNDGTRVSTPSALTHAMTFRSDRQAEVLARVKDGSLPRWLSGLGLGYLAEEVTALAGKGLDEDSAATQIATCLQSVPEAPSNEMAPTDEPACDQIDQTDRLEPYVQAIAELSALVGKDHDEQAAIEARRVALAQEVGS